MSHLVESLRRRPAVAAALCGLLALALALPGLGNLGGASHGDEGFYLSVVTDMVDGGRIAPSHDGSLVFQKPPLVFWAARLAMALFGRDAFAARLVAALAAAATCAAGALFAAETAGPEAAPIAGLLLAGSFGITRFSRELMLDLPLAACLAASLVNVARALPGRPRALVWAGFFGGLSLGVKGPIGPFVLLLAAAAALAGLRRLELLRRPPLWWGALAGAAISLPWFAWMIATHPREFWETAVVDQYFRRFSSAHGQMRLGLLWGTLLYAAPFLPVAAVGLVRAIRLPEVRRRSALALGWLLAFYVVFSLPEEHGLHYPLLVLVPLAALAAEAALAGGEAARWTRRLVGLTLLAATAALLAAARFGVAAWTIPVAAPLLLAAAVLWSRGPPIAAAAGSGAVALASCVVFGYLAPAVGRPLVPAGIGRVIAGRPVGVYAEHPGPFRLATGAKDLKELWGEGALRGALDRDEIVLAPEHALAGTSPALRARMVPFFLWRRTRPYLAVGDVWAAWRAGDLDALGETCALYRRTLRAPAVVERR